jgi:Uma2 family endonuclease
MSAMPKTQWTRDLYLEFERTSEVRHEFVGGEIYAMAGASRTHTLIGWNIGGSLFLQFGDRQCEAHQNDLRVRVSATGNYHYPDIVVVCGEPQLEDDAFDTLLNPIVIIEILSPSTKDYDRGTKFNDYRQIATLQEYILVNQDKPHLERYLRQPSGDWLLTDIVGLEAILRLPSIECKLALADVYKRVRFETA